jgi:hypothetical protein
MASRLFWFWNLRGRFSQGRRQLRRIVGLFEHVSDLSVRAKLLHASGAWHFCEVSTTTPNRGPWGRGGGRRTLRPKAHASDRSIGRAARLLILPEASKGDRVAQAVHRGDAVLPFGPGGTLQQVRRARLGGERSTLPGRACSAPQPKHARRHEGDAHHLSEHTLVPVPADRGSRRILRHQHMLEQGGGEARKSRRLLAKGEQESWNVLGPPELLGAEVVR